MWQHRQVFCIRKEFLNRIDFTWSNMQSCCSNTGQWCVFQPKNTVSTKNHQFSSNFWVGVTTNLHEDQIFLIIWPKSELIKWSNRQFFKFWQVLPTKTVLFCKNPLKKVQYIPHHFLLILYLADQLILFQPGGRGPPFTTGTPKFFHLPASLLIS